MAPDVTKTIRYTTDDTVPEIIYAVTNLSSHTTSSKFLTNNTVPLINCAFHQIDRDQGARPSGEALLEGGA